MGHWVGLSLLCHRGCHAVCPRAVGHFAWVFLFDFISFLVFSFSFNLHVFDLRNEEGNTASPPSVLAGACVELSLAEGSRGLSLDWDLQTMAFGSNMAYCVFVSKVLSANSHTQPCTYLPSLLSATVSLQSLMACQPGPSQRKLAALV